MLKQTKTSYFQNLNPACKWTKDVSIVEQQVIAGPDVLTFHVSSLC